MLDWIDSVLLCCVSSEKHRKLETLALDTNLNMWLLIDQAILLDSRDDLCDVVKIWGNLKKHAVNMGYKATAKPITRLIARYDKGLNLGNEYFFLDYIETALSNDLPLKSEPSFFEALGKLLQNTSQSGIYWLKLISHIWPETVSAAKSSADELRTLTDLFSGLREYLVAIESIRESIQPPFIADLTTCNSCVNVDNPCDDSLLEINHERWTRQFLGKGKRKNAGARVRIVFPGSGKFLVNGRCLKSYFQLAQNQSDAVAPMAVLHSQGDVNLMQNQIVTEVTSPTSEVRSLHNADIYASVRGGGVSGQAGAIQRGLACAICNYAPEMRKALKEAGILSSDCRRKERKKPGKRGARRRKQFSKR